MSREIDMDNLSEEDILYLQERGKRPPGVDPIKPDPEEEPDPDDPLKDVPYTGDVGLPHQQDEPAFVNEGVEIEDNYDSLNTEDLKQEIQRRNAEGDTQISTGGSKATLIQRLRDDDQRRVQSGELVPEEEG